MVDLIWADSADPADFFWAHRGLSGSYPENTIPSLSAAYESGAKWIETDVDICDDGTLLICHDSTLDRTTNVSGRAVDLVAEDLAHVDAGGWFSPKFVGTPLPSLDEVVALVNETGGNLNLELKPTEAGARAAHSLVSGVLDELEAIEDPSRVLISSFSPLLLATLHQAAPQYPIACLFEQATLGPDWLTVCELVGASAIHPELAGLTREMVQEFKAAGLQVHVWTVNDLATANKLRNWGVDAVFTDFADRFIAAWAN
ncbi:hypothetical protein BK816_07330 [Boudabousia tangfeifanii]|uniref:GP-PDE domain-containing protein n=1 Tax=Boudabousia tangfeifanii TaxID=1912795 RepID=A0A1D9MLI0_9ACTO|nr:glycerophosphodiester phosphodiesterase family protein [Boudabousia tangfeifanii]AOZ73125.1 hypothetical protein BK816_07330 [Boudabousia tangfeifanii]